MVSGPLSDRRLAMTANLANHPSWASKGLQPSSEALWKGATIAILGLQAQAPATLRITGDLAKALEASDASDPSVAAQAAETRAKVEAATTMLWRLSADPEMMFYLKPQS